MGMKRLYACLMVVTLCTLASQGYETLKEALSAANGGDAAAQYEVGKYYMGIHLESDYQNALKYLRKSAAQGYEPAQRKLKEITSAGYDGWGDFELTPYYIIGYFTGDFEQKVIEKADAGRADAALLLAHSYFIKEEYELAVKYYEKCLSQLGHEHYYLPDGEEMWEFQVVMDATSMLGYCYEHGLGVKKDLLRALAYYELLGGYADTPDNEVCREIKTLTLKYNNPVLTEITGECGGQVYDGFFPSPPASRAFSKAPILYLKLSKTDQALGAIEANEAFEDSEWNNVSGSLLNMWAGELYYKGIVKPQDYNKAFKIFKYIADRPKGAWGVSEFEDDYPDVYADVCYRLYECYSLGRGVEKDSNKARYYFQQALKFGSSSALYDDQRRYEIVNN